MGVGVRLEAVTDIFYVSLSGTFAVFDGNAKVAFLFFTVRGSMDNWLLGGHRWQHRQRPQSPAAVGSKTQTLGVRQSADICDLRWQHRPFL